jgi:hypothetical protein
MKTTTRDGMKRTVAGRFVVISRGQWTECYETENGLEMYLGRLLVGSMPEHRSQLDDAKLRIALINHYAS